jgi:hypothetical protein
VGPKRSHSGRAGSATAARLCTAAVEPTSGAITDSGAASPMGRQTPDRRFRVHPHLPAAHSVRRTTTDLRALDPSARSGVDRVSDAIADRQICVRASDVPRHLP